MCPAQVLGVGEFDVADRPGRESRYDSQVGYRVHAGSGVGVCVHPYRVGLPPGCYASGGEPLPAAGTPAPGPAPEHLELPEDLVDLEAWLVAVLRTTVDSDELAPALARAEAMASGRFHPRDVGVALRRVLTVELVDVDRG